MHLHWYMTHCDKDAHVCLIQSIWIYDYRMCWTSASVISRVIGDPLADVAPRDGSEPGKRKEKKEKIDNSPISTRPWDK